MSYAEDMVAAASYISSVQSENLSPQVMLRISIHT